MAPMPPMLAYSIQSYTYPGQMPYLVVGYGSNAARFVPTGAHDDSYWFLFLDAKNPKQKVKEFLVPGSNNTSVPAGIQPYMDNPDLIFALATQYLSTIHIPQGAFYDFLIKYGAGKELQRMEQRYSVFGCGSFGWMNYILTGACGPRGIGSISYETGSGMLLMSLMPMPNGQPPYSICESYTFHT